jgi:two-component system response regulator YesN
MYQVIIADDEKITRDSLRNIIPWNKLGIEQVITVKNGLEALALAQTFHPNILITDIRMPKMDGLKLATQIRKLFPECKIIFLTGYADKAYLKTAIRLKVNSYIEKPINQEEIQAAIRETVALCEAKLQQNRAMARLKDHLDDSAPLIRQAIALKLVNEGADIAGLTARYGEFSLPLQANDCYTVAYTVTHWEANLETLAINRYQQTLLTAIADPAGFMAGFDPAGNFVLIYHGKLVVTSSASQTILDTLVNMFEQLTEAKCRFTVGVGNVVTGPSRIPVSYRTAVSATAQQFYNSRQRIFYPATFSVGSPPPIDKVLLVNFKNNLKEDNFESAKALVRDLTGQLAICRDSDHNRIKNIYFQLMLVLFEVALERELTDPFAAKEKTYIWKEIETKTYLEELSAYVTTSIDNILSKPVDSGLRDRKTTEIIRFIQQNFANKTLSIPVISAHIYLSPTYLCAFFKKSTGKTINEFITETRITKAKELLKDVQIKLYEIATAVGFTDVNYFSTLFKRNTGCTPTEFRERYYR